MLVELSLVVVVLWLFFGVAKTIRRRIIAKRLGCMQVRCPDRNDPFGWKAVRNLRQARVQGALLQLHGQSMDSVGKNPHTVVRKFLWARTLMTRDTANFKAVLSAQASDWELGTLRKDLLARYIGHGVLTVEGHAWKESRSRLRPVFAQDSISNFALLEDHCQDLIASFQFEADGWTHATDIQGLFFNMTFDVITEFLYGRSVYFQRLDARSGQIGSTEIDCLDDMEVFRVNNQVARQWIVDVAALGQFHWLVPARAFSRACNHVRGMVGRLADKALHEDAKGKERVGGRYILLKELAKFTRDKTVLVNETLGLLSAGRSTTASALSWLFHYLAQDPALYQRLRSEVHRCLGTSADVGDVDAHKLRACRYLQQCIREALRLGSPTPITVRQATQDTTLPQGGGPDGQDPIFVSKGTTILLDVFLLHRREDLWGADVEKFRPERWDNQDRSWEYLPFGAGLRACIGREFSPV
ncbi:MAG: hypothetical protein Q9190_003538 [Brigantiaea leucoxantha]